MYFFLLSCSEQKKIITSKFNSRIAIVNSSEYIKSITRKNYDPWNPNKLELNIIDAVLEKAEQHFLTEETIETQVRYIKEVEMYLG
ncbi:hypothetical protein C4F50_10540 [Flavobacterium sp. KB82]|uniref:Uncharacterized protein n=1 Tax=Flavobacterium hungaricum TaxID=2082725 RepID=A0ABR9TJ56_9FLAO|nr:hypothetical protein [Flavobacterium hungaricum]